MLCQGNSSLQFFSLPSLPPQTDIVFLDHLKYQNYISSE